MHKPLIASTWSFGAVGNAAGWKVLAAGGSAGDAVEHAANAIEDDPRIDSVGVGGLPDINGEVVLDAGFMESPERWGAVLAIRNFQNPSSIAKRVATRFGRGIRAGCGAEEFAAREGFERSDLLTERAKSWWQSTLGQSESIEPFVFRDGNDGTLFQFSEAETHFHDTVGVVALDSQGQLAAVTSTSGLPLKHNNRIGDSAIPGHGIYVEPDLGAVVATGTGELISSCCAAVRVLDFLRRKGSLLEALRATLSHLANHGSPGPEDQAAFVLVTREGDVAAGALRPGFRYCLISEKVSETRDPGIVHFS